MKPIHATVVAALLAASGLSQQIPLPTHASTYNGFSRGFNYTAPVDHIITQLDLPANAFQAGDTAGYLVRINGAVALHSTGNAGAIAANIRVDTGDIVDVLGNWSPAATGSFSAHNSYGNFAPFASNVLGAAVTLNRVGWQWDIGSANYTAGSYLPPTTGPLGRVLVTVAPQANVFADFSSDVQSGPSPLTVAFQDTSTTNTNPIIGWQWDFEHDGTIDSTAQHPIHTYVTCGSHDVSLTVTDGITAPATVVKTAYIRTDATTAAFTDTLVAPLMVQFTDGSAGSPTSWAWDLDGDGTTDSTVQNPTATYPNTNPVTVSLTVQRLCGAASTTSKAVVAAQQLTTTFANNNSLGPGATMLFDVDISNADGITITGLDINTTAPATLPFAVDVWVCAGGLAGNEQDPGAWTRIAQAVGTASGAGGTPSPAPFVTPAYLPAGTYGLALHYGGAGPDYTDGNGTNQTYGNGDLTLALGISRGTTAGAPFGAGQTFDPRVWNGTIYYETFAFTGTAAYDEFGAGCPSSLGVPSLTENAAPVLGTTMTVTVDNMPAPATGLMMIGFSKTTSILGPLPLDSAAFGAPGCSLRVSPEINPFVSGAGNTAIWSLTIPNNATLAGVRIFQQVIVFEIGINAAGAVNSNAAAMLVGN